MAVGEIPRPQSPTTHPHIDVANLSLRDSAGMRGEREILDKEADSGAPSFPAFKESIMFVALGKDVRESELVLMWALHNSRGMKICILHVHQPAQKIPMMGTKVPIGLVEEHQVRAYHEVERQEMHKILDKYIRTCERSGVQAQKLLKESDSIERGIVELISEHGIRQLVMGAAANRSYSRRMKEPKSRKANHVRTEAPTFCTIWFVCKGNLIFTREGKLGDINMEAETPPFQLSPYPEDGGIGQMKLQSSALNYGRARSDHHGMQLLAPSSGSKGSFPRSCSNPEGNSNWDMYSLSAGSQYSTASSDIIEHSSALISPSSEGSPSNEANEIGPELPMIPQKHGDQCHCSVASSVTEGSVNDELYDKLEQFVAEAHSSRKEAYEESVRRQKAEKDVIDAIRKVKASETMYAEEQRRRREIEETLARRKEEAEKMKRQLNEVFYDLRAAKEEKFSLERQIADSDKMIEDLEHKMFSAVGLLQKYKNERDELQVQRDNALREAEELRRKQTEEASSSSVCQFFTEFTFLEIEEATNNFCPSMKIGEGGYGSIYIGNLRHTQVAIKMLNPNSSQGPFEFQQEVDILSKLRHPNIVTLIGACPEAWALIYEYLPNGSLEDRLTCKNNTPPLSWKARIQIAAELCSALMFLHSCHPQGVVHGDLKPSNVLLDANFVCKLGDFGICCQLPKDDFTENNTAVCYRTNPVGTTGYIDPEFLASGELTSKSDVFSFGIIMLRLLTGRPALGITNEVQYAIDKGNLKDLLDPTAGDWPFVQAKQLAHLALSCSNMKRRGRPDLASEVWKVLEPMKVSCGVSSLRLGSEERYQTPSYFVCPIFQEIMQEPVVAADGFTYESEALKGWLESGNDTSPMTNLKLLHCDMLPNHALRSAIQEWLHTP